MAKGKLILICQSGGEFVKNEDETMSYNGGEANAANVTSETPFSELKLKLAETCNFNQDTVTIKYFVPGNKRNLITLKNDKDVKRMIEFYGDALTAEVFVTGTAGFIPPAVEVQINRKNDNLNTEKDETVKKGKVGTKKDKKVKKEQKVAKSPLSTSPAKRTRRAIAAAKTEASSRENEEGKTKTLASDGVRSEGSSGDTSTSSDSEHVNTNASRYPKRKKPNGRNETDGGPSPADRVKKRRRTPSWKVGANGRPTIVSGPDDSVGSKPKPRGKRQKASDESTGGRKSQRKSGRLAAKVDNSKETKVKRKRGRPRATLPLADTNDQKLDIFVESSDPSMCDEDVSIETLVTLWKSAIIGVGQQFKSVHEFREALQKYALANDFAYNFKKNDTNRVSGECAAEGCSWKFNAVWVPTTQSFKIKTLKNVHTCGEESGKSAYPTKNWFLNTIKERLQESPHLKPKEIATGILRDFGVDLNEKQVSSGIGIVKELPHASDKEDYNKLPWFCEKIVETNPGSIRKLVIGEKKRFKSLFVSFYASLFGFQNSCRPLLFLEATSLRSKYGEVLLTANAIDGNDGFFPLAFGIVDVEDDKSWRWFLEQLKAAILNSLPITFVFDQEKNLKMSLLEVFEDAHVGYSIYHLLESFKRNVKGPFHGEGKAFLPVYFLAAAHSVRLGGFRKSMDQIKQISSQAYDWVMQIEPQHWATSSFNGVHYNHIIDDVGESLSKLMEDCRELPILQKIDTLIRTMSDAIIDAKLDASMWSTHLTPSKEKHLQEESLKSIGLRVLISTDTLFEVREDSTHVVNISTWSCTCLGWKETGLPCRHALAVFTLTGRNPYEFCSNYFTVDTYHITYAESINPVPINNEKIEIEEEKGIQIDTNTDSITPVPINNEEKDEQIEMKNGDGEKEEGEKIEIKDGKEDGKIEKGETEDNTNKELLFMVEDEKSKNGETTEEEKVEKIEIGIETTGGENEDSGKAKDEKEEGQKDEGEKIKINEELEVEHEDPNVFVLPPIPAKPVDLGKEKTEWDETEVETKRTVTCTNCKQPGHNKKSCNLYQSQRAC